MKIIVAKLTHLLLGGYPCTAQTCGDGVATFRSCFYSRAASRSGTAAALLAARTIAQSASFPTGNSGGALSSAYSIMHQLRAFLFGSMVIATIAKFTDDASSLLLSLPRTLRTVAWAMRAGAAYKQFYATAYLSNSTPQEFQEALGALHTHWAIKLLAVCRANGGVYIKAGQFASAFGAVPREFRTVLSQLEDRAVPRPYPQVRRMLLAELGKDVDSIFKEFDHKATAAASLAQVHRAVLASGEAVAVKVQYPGLASSVASDLTTIKLLSRAAEVFFPAYRLSWLYDELEQKLAVELDFRNEQANALRFADLLAKARITNVHVPELHLEYCTSRIITMEWIDGYKVTDVDSLQRKSINPRSVGLKLVKLFGELMFVHGYVHGDPHPGNVMVRPVGRPRRFAWLFGGSRQPFELVLLDHGVYVTVDDCLREQFCQLWCAIMRADERTQTDISAAMGGPRAGKVLPVLLTHKAKTREEERELQRKVGINNFGDITQLLALASRALVDLLRINTVIRGTSNLLGVSMAERIHIYSAIALRGLPRRGTKQAHVHKSFDRLWYRLQLSSIVTAIGLWSWSRAVASRTWEVVLSVFGEALFE